ncbi:MAG: amidohydrolase family protein [Chloroflexi bacterium]|nr:amidohydrolase family protein [Chloroflexota bacterium]
MTAALPARPPFVLRARILSPLSRGGVRHELDGRLEVGPDGRIASVGPWSSSAMTSAAPSVSSSASDRGALPVADVRPWVVLPGLVDLHAHVPQLSNAGLGFGLPLLEWLERYIFPLERAFDAPAAERLAPAAFRAFAAAGSTTVMAYGALWEPSMDVVFRAAEAHGIRAVIGKVMMDRLTYDAGDRTPREVLDLSLRQSADLCARWHGRDDGRLRYAFTPRFAVSCTAEMLRESARLAERAGAYWQTHLSEDVGEVAEVGRLFPEAKDYLDVYDRAAALSPRAVLAHAIHLSDREVRRLAESGARVAHCPESNLFLASGTMPLARYLEAGIPVGLGSDVAGGPDPSIFRSMRVGAYVQNVRRIAGFDAGPILGPLDWLRLGTLDGARALGLDDAIGSLEAGKDADLIVVDASATDLLDVSTGSLEDPTGSLEDPTELVSRFIFRSDPRMVRGAWVRGRRLEGPLA